MDAGEGHGGAGVSTEVDRKKLPTAVITIGMAGSGKTTLMQRMIAHLSQHKMPRYVVNIDPAVKNLPYQPNVDVRNSINYKEVMKQYGLGPNGGIVTALNLFATQFSEVVSLCQKRQDEVDYILLDTPGQIEVFTWSASGTIITESLAVTFPTCVLYVVDTTRTTSPATFMSNMLYACSILYKTRLPFVLAFNKCDVASPSNAKEWMKDYDALFDALQADGSYMSSLTRSMSLVLQEFYENLTSISCSAVTGQGIPELFAALDRSQEEYYRDYHAALLARIEDNKVKELARQTQQMKLVEEDLRNELAGKGLSSAPQRHPNRGGHVDDDNDRNGSQNRDDGRDRDDDDDDDDDDEYNDY